MIKLRVRSNGAEVEMRVETWKKLSEDQKSAYDVLEKKEAPKKETQPVQNRAGGKQPENGEKK